MDILSVVNNSAKKQTIKETIKDEIPIPTSLDTQVVEDIQPPVQIKIKKQKISKKFIVIPEDTYQVTAISPKKSETLPLQKKKSTKKSIKKPSTRVNIPASTVSDIPTKPVN